jgi:ribonuclease G
VRQLRLRDIGGIIVIDFIDMANPKNRATVEEALRTELERDRTKTYVVEISPLGLVEMTRQNVTDGPREVMTRKCPTCGGDGIVYSEASAAIDVERRLRALVAGSRSQAYRVELSAGIAAALVGPGASRLMELEALTKRRFFLDGKPDTHLDHFVVVGEGKLEDLAPAAPVAEGAELMLELVEVDRHDPSAADGKVDGYNICVGGAADLVGKRVKVKVERVLDGVAYASLMRKSGKKPVEPLTAEGEAEKPTRRPPARKTDEAVAAPEPEAAEAIVEEAEAATEPDETAEDAEAGSAAAKKKTRRGSRGGRKRKKPAGAAADGEAPAEVEDGAEEAPPAAEAQPRAVRIHVPGDDLGKPDEPGAEEAPAAPEEPAAEEAVAEDAPDGEDVSENGDRPATPAKKKTRRGSRGGKNRRKRTTAEAGENGDEPAGEAAEAAEAPEAVAVEEPSRNGSEGAEDDEWGYVPMSEWGDEFS